MEYLPESKSTYGYVNESERNVHIWCSIVKASTNAKFRGQPTLGLIAGGLGTFSDKYSVSSTLGCFVRGLPIYVFYKWLDMILYHNAHNGQLCCLRLLSLWIPDEVYHRLSFCGFVPLSW